MRERVLDRSPGRERAHEGDGVGEGERQHRLLDHVGQRRDRIEHPAQDEHRGDDEGEVVAEEVVGRGDRAHREGGPGEGEADEEEEGEAEQGLGARDRPEQRGDEQDRAARDAALGGAPEHLPRDDVVHLEGRREHPVVGLLGDHAGIRRVDPLVRRRHHRRRGDQPRREEREVVDPLHLPDEPPEAEAEPEQVEHRLAEVEQEVGHHQAAPHPGVAPPHRERERARRGKAPVTGGPSFHADQSRSSRPVSRRNTSSRFAGR